MNHPVVRHAVRCSAGVALLAISACGTPSEPDPSGPNPSEPAAAAAQRPNVVLVTLDTTRADRIGAWGYGKARTDTIDALAAAGRRYARAYSPLPLTIPSHATMFTGLYPPHHGIRSNGGGTLDERFTTLTEVLHDAGYATAASIPAFVTTRQWGFAQGFDAYFDDVPSDAENFWHGERRGDLVVDDALAWKATQAGDKPLFIWVHLYDAHFPYAPPETYVDTEDYRPYDAELAFVDDQIARLVEAFAGSPTLFVLAGDHGEGLGEHGELTHSLYAYDSTQHVPFLLSGAGVPAGEVVDQPVSLVDLMPTVLGVVGLDVPGGLDGRVRPSEAAEPVYMESWQLAERFAIAPHLAIVDGAWKLFDLPRPELYDVLADPSETTDLSADHAADVARLKARLEAWVFEPPTAQSAPSDPAVAAQLAALGYVEGGGGVDLSGDLPDPKDHTSLVMRVNGFERRMAQKDTEGAEKVLRSLIADYPEVMEFRNRLVNMLARAGRDAEAAKEVDAALAVDPENTQLMAMRAGQLAAAGRFAEAADAFTKVAIEAPYTPRMRGLAVASLRRAGKADAALARGMEWLDTYPDDANLSGIVGVLLMEQRRVEEAVPRLRKGLEADTPELEVAWYLASWELAQGNIEKGAELLAVELEHYPQHLRAAVVLVRIDMRLQRWDDQLTWAAHVLEGNPADAEMWHARVLALFNLGRFAEAREAVAKGLAVDPKNPDLILMDANLLAKEGRMDEGKQRFELAKAALQRREAERAGRDPALIEELGVPDVEHAGEPALRDLPDWEDARP